SRLRRAAARRTPARDRSGGRRDRTADDADGGGARQCGHGRRWVAHGARCIAAVGKAGDSSRAAAILSGRAATGHLSARLPPPAAGPAGVVMELDVQRIVVVPAVTHPYPAPHLGSVLAPIRNASTAWAAWRPSRMAQTT